MDTFREIMQKLAKMPEQERKRLVDAGMARCICGKCPDYNTCAKNAQEGFYCAVCRSFNCISYDKGCICPRCPVTSDPGLKYKEFNLRGSEKAHRYENTIRGSKIT